jgi:pimeloyl-ACP methyl ester carboxylesterase
MTEKTILFLHGFASSARSTKAQYLDQRLAMFSDVVFRAIDLNPTPRDFEYMTTTGTINRLRQFVLDHTLERFSIIGSSYGGLIAVQYAHRFGAIEKILLLAPGLRWLSGGLSQEELTRWKESGRSPVFHPAFGKELPIRYDLHMDGLSYLQPIPPTAPTMIIHGHRDTAVPIGDSQQYALKYPEKVRLIEVDADHDLNDHLPLIWKHVQSFLLDASSQMLGIGETQGAA